MLPKDRRIERSIFSHILAKSVRYHSNSFVLYVSKINNDINKLSKSKFSFSVSKKILKSSVDRNKQRRRGYSIIQRNINTIKLGNYYFFVFKKGFYKDYSDLEKDVVGLLLSSGMII
jgi:ribonuclease P protein component